MKTGEDIVWNYGNCLNPVRYHPNVADVAGGCASCVNIMTLIGVGWLSAASKDVSHQILPSILRRLCQC